MMLSVDSLLTVDAGGTKTSAWLVDFKTDSIHVIGRGHSTGGNPLSVGFAEATRAISDAVAQARTEAELPSVPARAILSIAGAADVDMRHKIIQWAHESGLSQQVSIVSDFLPVLAAGTPDCCGVALICGTGSSAFARSADGRTARCGGWGYLLGDEGSGFAIGRAALQHTLQILESQSPPDALARILLDKLDAKSISELTRVVYSSDALRAKIAAIAPLVVGATELDDTTAGAILESAARDLANLTIRAARAVDLADGRVAVAASGGVLVKAKPLRDRLEAELRNLGLNCTIHVVDEPLHGCVRLAAPEFAGTLVEWQ